MTRYLSGACNEQVSLSNVQRVGISKERTTSRYISGACNDQVSPRNVQQAGIAQERATRRSLSGVCNKQVSLRNVQRAGVSQERAMSRYLSGACIEQVSPRSVHQIGISQECATCNALGLKSTRPSQQWSIWISPSLNNIYILWISLWQKLKSVSSKLFDGYTPWTNSLQTL